MALLLDVDNPAQTWNVWNYLPHDMVYLTRFEYDWISQQL